MFSARSSKQVLSSRLMSGSFDAAATAISIAVAVGFSSSNAVAQNRRETPSASQVELRQATQNLVATLERCQREVKRVGRAQDCQSEVRAADPFTPRPRRTTIQGTGEEKAIEVSVLTEEQAVELFRKVRGMRELALNRPWDGCMARSQIISQRVEERFGIATGQVWMRKGNALAPWWGSFDVQMPGEKERVGVPWNMHVAPFVLVEKNGKNEVWMLDPVLDTERPLPQETWESRLSEKPRRNSIYTTSRFVYRSQHSNNARDRYPVTIRQALDDLRDATGY
jgi:hypothetical protein